MIVTRGEIIANRLLTISGDTIRVIDDTKKVKKYKASRYVDAANKYVIPCLWDMHVHLRGGNSLANATKAILLLVELVEIAEFDVARVVINLCSGVG